MGLFRWSSRTDITERRDTKGRDIRDREQEDTGLMQGGREQSDRGEM